MFLKQVYKGVGINFMVTQNDIKIVTNKDCKCQVNTNNSVGFGTSFTDKMFTMKYKEGEGWSNPQVQDFAPFVLSPASLVFHYAQEIFEGQKAYKWDDGSIAMFRPEMNIKRFNRSADRMCMPQVDEDVFMKALDTLVWEDREWIPNKHEHALYIRAAMIATDPLLGVRAGQEYTFFIINSPVGPYFPQGFNPVKIWVSDTYVRATEGGVGEAKTGGNYAASLKAMKEAKANGFSQVLWLDANERKYVEEVGTMNICFVEDGKLITPELSGSILTGITRDSVLTVAKEKGIVVEEKRISIDELCKGIASGKITECFGCGTACVISPVGELNYKGEAYVVNNSKIGEVTKTIYDEITGLQYGRVKDTRGWIKLIEQR